jgi:aminoglycoside phosphotransferase (APT) family kinase protein
VSGPSPAADGPLHDDELPIDVELVRALVERDAPQLADLPLRRLGDSGSTNALFRLGDDLLVRLPRQPGSGSAILKEQRWLPFVAPHLPVAVPQIVAVGEPGFGYPERWSLVRFLDGETPAPAAGTPRLAEDLAAVVVALRAIEIPPPARSDPGLRWYRGEPLAEIDGATRLAIEDCRGIADLPVDLDAALAYWEEAVRLPEEAEAPRWYHGDLLAENLLVRAGRLVAVLDFGGLAVGDPTVDLMVAWEIFDGRSRQAFREAAGADEGTWRRARAWAFACAINTFPYYWRTMPARCAGRVHIVRNVLADAGH